MCLMFVLYVCAVYICMCVICLMYMCVLYVCVFHMYVYNLTIVDAYGVQGLIWRYPSQSLPHLILGGWGLSLNLVLSAEARLVGQ